METSIAHDSYRRHGCGSRGPAGTGGPTRRPRQRRRHDRGRPRLFPAGQPSADAGVRRGPVSGGGHRGRVQVYPVAPGPRRTQRPRHRRAGRRRGGGDGPLHAEPGHRHPRMNDDEHSLLGERLNAEPTVFRGCTASELVTLVIIAAALWLPLGLAIGMAFGIVALVGTLFVVPTLFYVIKRGKPDGHYQIQLRILAAHYGLFFIKSDYVLRNGVWDIGRH